MNALTPVIEAKALPNNIEAEQALLGTILFDNEAFNRPCVDRLKPSSFYEPFHGRLFEAITAMIGKGQGAEPIVLMSRFKDDPAFNELGGLPYLADLVDRAPPSVNAPDYARVIHDMALRREVIRITGDLAAGAVEITDDGDAHDLIEDAEQQLFALAETGAAHGGFTAFSEYLTGALQMASEAYSRDGGLSGLATGLSDLDHKLGGLHKSDLIIIAGRPSMGKTALATNIAFHVARNYAWEQQPDGTKKTVNGGVVGFLSLEMSGEQLALRLLADVSGVSGDRLRRGDVRADEFGRVRDAAIEIQDAPLHIDATGGISIAKLCARARRLKRVYGLDLIVVDYLQLVTTTGRRSDNRTQEVSEITQRLKALAKELSVPVIALSQLSRQVEQREDKRPQLSDLRESGSIEQDADVVAFVYREEYYISRKEPRDGSPEHLAWLTDMEAARGQAEIIIGKQRHGPIGTVRVAFDGDTTKFSNLAREGHFAGSARTPYRED